MADLFKEIIPAILQNKEQVITPENESDYNAYVVNRALSFHYDTVLYANEMNKLPNTDAWLQFEFLIHSVRGYKRPFQPWQKIEKNDDLEVIKEYYNCSNEKAKQALELLSQEQLTIIKKTLYKGGIHDKPKLSNRGRTSAKR